MFLSAVSPEGNASYVYQEINCVSYQLSGSSSLKWLFVFTKSILSAFTLCLGYRLIKDTASVMYLPPIYIITL